jgi:hypothetical protein
MGKVASWRDVKALYDIDSKNSIRFCPKLAYQYIFLNGSQKMMVKYAA